MYFSTLRFKEWRRKSAVDKTWNHFKVHFAQAFKENREERANSGTRGYAVNVETCEAAITEESSLTEMAQYMTTALASLATDTNTARNAFGWLTKTIYNQSSHITTLTNKSLASN